MDTGDKVNKVWPRFEVWNRASGNLRLDIHDAENGYFYASVNHPIDKVMKLQVIKDNHKLHYPLRSDGTGELFPLQFGSGIYRITLCEQYSGTRYIPKGYIEVYVKLKREDAAFLIPNQMVMYDKDSEVVKVANEICKGMGEQSTYNAVCNYMKQNFIYDFIAAYTKKNTFISNVNQTFQKKSGVCQDLSAVFSAMLRSQDIPSKLVVGYADSSYHAWTSNMVNGKEVLFDPTAARYAIRPVKRYVAERFY